MRELKFLQLVALLPFIKFKIKGGHHTNFEYKHSLYYLSYRIFVMSVQVPSQCARPTRTWLVCNKSE